ncbi:MAG: asparagine synthase-related protein [Phycisphaerae bacterium]
MDRHLTDVVDLTRPEENFYIGTTHDEAVRRIASGDSQQGAALDGQFAIVARVDRRVRMARTIGRPLRYFIAKRVDGPMLIVAHTIGEIRDALAERGLADQFHPSYTRMVPAHHVTEIHLVGCPDPNPTYQRFFAPRQDRLPADPGVIGEHYIRALAAAVERWLETLPPRELIGVCFSGGIDSGAVFLTAYHVMKRRGENLARLKAFTLSLDGNGSDLAQAKRFLDALDLGLFLEPIEMPASAVDPDDAVRVLEDYKPLDVQAGAVLLALCRGIRARYPDWRYLLDGDGGDENLKDYPIEVNPELTIRSVLNNRMLYQEGWGVDSIKHSLTFSGGQSRGVVRTRGPAAATGFVGFSPLSTPGVIDVAEGIPFRALTEFDERRLYALKGEIMARGVRAVTGMTMPVFEKRRFQDGAGRIDAFDRPLVTQERRYRRTFLNAFAPALA